MLDWQDFDAAFQGRTDYTYDNRVIESIIKHRKEFGDQLFFDRIWKLIGLSRREALAHSSCQKVADGQKLREIIILRGRMRICAISGRKSCSRMHQTSRRLPSSTTC